MASLFFFYELLLFLSITSLFFFKINLLSITSRKPRKWYVYSSTDYCELNALVGPPPGMKKQNISSWLSKRNPIFNSREESLNCQIHVVYWSSYSIRWDLDRAVWVKFKYKWVSNFKYDSTDLETKHLWKMREDSINMACHRSFPLCHRTACQDQWLAHVWVTELKPNFWLLSAFVFTPKLPLSPRCSVMNACDPAHWTEPHCSKKVKQTINLSAQSEDSGDWNINLFFNLLFFLWVTGCLESTCRLETQKFKSEQTL